MIHAVGLEAKELVQAAFEGRQTQRAPWVPFVGCHAGALLDVPADVYLKSADLMFRGVDAAIARYQPGRICLRILSRDACRRLGEVTGNHGHRLEDRTRRTERCPITMHPLNRQLGFIVRSLHFT